MKAAIVLLTFSCCCWSQTSNNNDGNAAHSMSDNHGGVKLLALTCSRAHIRALAIWELRLWADGCACSQDEI